MLIPALSLSFRIIATAWAALLVWRFRDARLVLLAIAAGVLAIYDGLTFDEPQQVLRLTISTMTLVTVGFTGLIVRGRVGYWERIRASERLNRAVLENVTDAVFLTDGTGRPTHVWPTFEAVFGIDAGTALAADSVKDLFGVDLVDLDRLRQTGHARDIEHRLDIGGHVRWILVSARTTEIEGGAILFCSKDITERKRAEEALESALVEVETLKNRLEAENLYLQEELRLVHNFDEIIGSSPAVMEMLGKVEQVAATDATVLILGETGSGKELVARAIHNLSRRSDRPLVKLNCATLPANLVESELFGHEKGAFTGAVAAKAGRFEIADGGTIFLDEVGELPLDMQAKLLRVLQEGEVERVGSTRSRHVDVRVLAATNRDLQSEVQQGEFRADLFYRLNVFPIHVPPLRERRADIPALAAFFLEDCGLQIARQFTGFTRSSIDRMMAYAWPGNIRELRNVIERAAIVSRTPIVDVRPETMRHSPAPADRSLDAVEKAHIENVLRESGWVIEGPAGAAVILGLHPNTLRSRMKKLGIRRPARSI